MLTSPMSARYNGSIRLPLIGAFVLAVLIPAVIGNTLTAYLGLRSAEGRAAEQLVAISTFKANQIDLWLDDMQHDLAALAADTELQGFILRVLPGSRFATLAFDGASRLQTAFKQSIRQSQRFDSLFVLDREGTLLVSTDWTFTELQAAMNNQTAPVTLLDGPARLTRSALILPLRHSPDGRLELLLLHPVIDAAARPIAVIGGYANLDRLHVIMAERAGLGQGGETYLVDSGGLLGTSSHLPEADPTGITPVGTLPFAPDAAVRHYTNYRGVNMLGVAQPLDRMGATLVAELDEAETYSAITETTLLNVALAVIAAAAVMAGGVWFVNRRIIRPLIRLTSTARMISEGNLDVRVPLDQNDEIGLLANAFNTMTGHLSDVIAAERRAKQYLESIVAEYVAFVQRIASGDLTSRLALDRDRMMEGATEDLYMLGGNLNDMAESLSEMALQVRHAVETMVAIATEIQVATVRQNATVLEQDSAVTQTVATVEQVRNTVQQTAERARAVANVSQQSVTVSRNGQQAVVENTSGMQVIRQRVESIAETILMLSERTQQIGEIIDAVNALAEQSKLLALNASIEAARAGEEGKGFAVVAMEVRQLAEQSREATARVRTILSEIQQSTNTAVMVTEEGSKGAEQGISLAERTGEVIRELSATIEEAAQTAMQIAASTQEQTSGMDQLAAAILQIKQASEQTAAGTRQTEISIQNLMEMADQLAEATARYQLAALNEAD